jgi:hypothetical protein
MMPHQVTWWCIQQPCIPEPTRPGRGILSVVVVHNDLDLVVHTKAVHHSRVTEPTRRGLRAARGS